MLSHALTLLMALFVFVFLYHPNYLSFIIQKMDSLQINKAF